MYVRSRGSLGDVQTCLGVTWDSNKSSGIRMQKLFLKHLLLCLIVCVRNKAKMTVM